MNDSYICSSCKKTVRVGAWPFCPHGYGQGTLAGGNAQWSDRDMILVFKKPDGEYSYPMTNSKSTPKGCERIELRSLREVESFERKAGVKNEAMHFDRNGRGFDDTFRGEKFN